MEIYYQPDLSKNVLFLSEDESRHCIKVLRSKAGDKIIVVDGKGLRVNAEIAEPNPKKCTFLILDKENVERNKAESHIAITPTKNIDRTEWFVEKAVEIGVESIDFYYAKHSERRKIKLERLEKKAIGAMKQSGQSFLPEINLYKNFPELIKAKTGLNQHFIAYVDFENKVHLMDSVEKGRSSIVLIGPEGDFSKDELQLALDSGYSKVSLGDNRLRTETAGLAACYILNLVNR